MMRTRDIVTATALTLSALAMPACDDDNDGWREITNGNTYKFNDGKSEGFAKGADVSWLTEMEDNGMKFYAADGAETECMALLKSKGVEAIRLRVWVDPKGGYCDKADLIEKAVRASQLGLDVMVDFHYSDSWADPSNQAKPAAWSGYTFDELRKAVADHTTDILTSLKNVGVTPVWAQIGNEVGDGMLWPDGKASLNATNFAKLVSAGVEAAKAACPDIKTIVHVQNGWNFSTSEWITDILKNGGVEYDIFGVSLYPSLAIEEITTETITATDAVKMTISNLETLAKRFDKEMMICEFGYSVSDPDMAYECLSMIVEHGKKSNTISGVFYWEPECYDWNGYDKGAFGEDHKPLHTLDAFSL